MKKFLALILASLMILSMAACSGGANEGTASGAASGAANGVKLDYLNVCLASEPDTIDPALNSAVDGATLVSHLFAGLAKWAPDETGALTIVADCAESLPKSVKTDDGYTYTYTLKEGLKWSDGKELKASDFVFAWKRAASADLGADYGYMFDVIKGYNEGNLAVTADDAARTITVTLTTDVAYWNELLAFPTYFPVREDVVADEAWATKPETYICNGPYTLASWQHDSLITMKKNANYHDAASVTMPTLNFYLSDDANNMLANYKSGEWLMIDDVPTNEIANLKKDYADEFVIAGQLGTYYVCWNVNADLGVKDEAAKAEIRKALGLVFDRNYICESIAQGGQVPASSFVAMGLTEADGKTQFYQVAGDKATNGYAGYYNVAPEAIDAAGKAAQDTLKKYYNDTTKAPTLTYLYNEGDAHKAIGEYLQAAFKKVGITMNLESQEWNTFLNTRKDGNFSIARNGWLGDYNDPISFLDMWTTASGNNDCQLGKGAHAKVAIYNLDMTKWGGENVTNGTWAETYDVLIDMIKKSSDNEARFEMMHAAEDLLMSTGAIVPIYYYTDLYMISDAVSGFYSSPLGYKYFQNTTVTVAK